MRAGDRLEATQTKLKETAKEWEVSRKAAVKAKKDFEDVKQKRLELFQKAFDHISDNIGGTYKDLTKSAQFPLGGQAYLDMEDSTEPYLAGLKYHAMPPLKRFRDMEHLSGGEKTIAALALLFAIHSYQPSPFFVLDEVDAALDNVNVGRVAKYVSEHASPGMQFIVISLKAGFFQESESLVGVMRDQAKMSSRVVSLDVSSLLPPSSGITFANDAATVEEISAFVVIGSRLTLFPRSDFADHCWFYLWNEEYPPYVGSVGVYRATLFPPARLCRIPEILFLSNPNQATVHIDALRRAC
jgi:energy-coupling factor transporter ATP-binding protein EcfA2